MTDTSGSDQDLGDRLQSKFDELKAELQPKLQELGERANTLIDEVQQVVQEASAKLDQWQAERGQS